MDNRDIIYWQFETLYTFDLETSSSAINFQINQPPENGLCTIYPLQGITSTMFNINCLNWSDTDGIQKYSAYGKYLFFSKGKSAGTQHPGTSAPVQQLGTCPAPTAPIGTHSGFHYEHLQHLRPHFHYLKCFLSIWQ